MSLPTPPVTFQPEPCGRPHFNDAISIGTAAFAAAARMNATFGFRRRLTPDPSIALRLLNERDMVAPWRRSW